jgi:nicotinamide mononucleotide transporter
VTNLEIIATLLGIANILLIIRRSVWNYPFALGMVALYGFIFAEARLYSDAGLQIFFFAVNLYGWWAWKRHEAGAGMIIVERLSRGGLARWIGGSILAIILWGTIMAQLTNASYPYWDGAIAMLSVAAQILMTRRFLENWQWWIVVNLVSIPLYVIKGLNLTAGLYGLFLVLATIGYREWRKAGANQ